MALFPTVLLHMSAEEYPKFFAGLRADSRLPPTHEEWCKQQRAFASIVLTIGSTPQVIQVFYDEYMAYTERLDVEPTYSMLLAYAASLSFRQDRNASPPRLEFTG